MDKLYLYLLGFLMIIGLGVVGNYDYQDQKRTECDKRGLQYEPVSELCIESKPYDSLS